MNNNNNFLALVKYETANVLNGFFTPFFGIVFPAIMGSLLATFIPSQVPDEFVKETTTAIVLTMASMIPLATMLVSFPTSYAQEVENKVIDRLSLFDISEKKLLLVKVTVNYAIMTLSYLFYAIVLTFVTKGNLLVPTLSSFIIYVIVLYSIATIYFVLSFSLANILKKFGTTYAITMIVYFMTMMFSGMMGAQPDQLPSGLRAVSKFFPTSYLNTDFTTYWGTGFSGYNFAPFLQAMLFWIALAAIVYIYSQYKNRSLLK